MKYIYKLSLLLLLSFVAIDIQSQIGGRYAYEFLGSPQSPRITALGGSAIAVKDEDFMLATANPALLNSENSGRIAINHNFSLAGVSNGHLGFAKAFDSLGIVGHVGVSYISFGDFISADEFGNDNGTFSGNEAALVFGASKILNERITAGVNLKTIFGSLEEYSSFGLAADIGLTYQKPNSNTVIAFVVKNVGTQLSTYGNERVGAPLDIQLGISQRLKHLPFRFSIIAHQLQRWGVRYDDPNLVQDDSILGEEVSEASSFSKGLDNLFRHFIFNGEFLLGKTQGFKLRFGYNHLRRKELSLSNFKSLSGFSAGFGIRIKGFQIDYGLGFFHHAGGANHLAISTDLDRFFKKF